jgi:hypothetical protein
MSLIHIEQGLQAMPSHPDLLSLKRDVLKQQADLQRQEETARRQEEAAHQQATALSRPKQNRNNANVRRMSYWRGRWMINEIAPMKPVSCASNRVCNKCPIIAACWPCAKTFASNCAKPKPRRPPPIPVVKPPIDDTARIAALLQQCETHLQANRLTAGKGGNAADCYREVIKRDRGNAEALAGLDRIADRYAELVSTALQATTSKSARSSLARIEAVNPSIHNCPGCGNNWRWRKPLSRWLHRPDLSPYPSHRPPHPNPGRRFLPLI